MAVRLGAVVLTLLQLVSAAAFATEPPSSSFAGLSLLEAVARLQDQGLAIVYSSALVRPDMVVAEEPTAHDPRSILDEILRPHGLMVREGPGGQLVVVRALRDQGAEAAGSIRGWVRVDRERQMLSTITVEVIGTGVVTTVDDDGRFSMSSVPAGVYTLRAQSAAFLPSAVDGVEVRAGDATTVHIHVVPASVFLDEIVVTPSHFRILEEHPESRQFLSREEVDQMPHVADDLYRAVKRLPGAAGGDISAEFNVRGGATDEVLVILDGLELYEPFHLKDFQNIFSTVDAEAVGGVDFLTGGFPVEYGDRMSGVMDISVATPTGGASASIGVSTINARFLTEGAFDDDRGHWLVSGRGWYPDAVAELAGATADEILSDYYDVLAKVEHRVGSRSLLAGNVLVAYDNLGFQTADVDGVEQVAARYNSHHLWLNLRTQWSDTLFSQTVLSTGTVKRHRTGGVVDLREGTLDIDDDRAFDFVGLKQDWSLELNDRHVLKWGFDLENQDAEYDYRRVSVVTDPEVIGDGPPLVDETRVEVAPQGDSYGVYVGDRFRLGDRVVAEVGLRWDRQLWLGEHQVSPRANLMYSVDPRTTLRFAWGRFHQSQRLNELQVEDGVTELFPAQLAEHWLASVEHLFAGGLGVRVEAYYKELDDIRPRYENLFSPIELFPEAQQDRVLVAPQEGRAHGAEVLLRHDSGKLVSWWLSYAVARAEDFIDGSMVPRSWDQRHAASFGLNLSLPRSWNVNLAGTYHSGWPTTAVTGEVVDWDGDEPVVELSVGPRNRERYSHYHRLDLRASKRWYTGRGELALILDIINFTNRRNVCCVDEFTYIVHDDESVEVIREERFWAPIIPSLGFRWRF